MAALTTRRVVVLTLGSSSGWLRQRSRSWEFVNEPPVAKELYRRIVVLPVSIKEAGPKSDAGQTVVVKKKRTANRSTTSRKPTETLDGYRCYCAERFVVGLMSHFPHRR